MGINTSNPLDASDITDLAAAKEEIKRLRAVAALGANNILLLTDSYKVTHWVQYPRGTRTIYSYFESRGGKHVEVVHFGLQYFLKRYLCGVVVTPEKIAEAEMMYSAHFGPGSVFPRDKWMYIVEHHGGKLPIHIRAPAEGTVIPYKNVLMTVENTDPKCFWLTNFLETLLVQVWYPTTVASNSRAQMKVIKRYLMDTADKLPTGDYGEFFKLHDFGFRGVSSVETSALGAAAHLVNFRGTDTISGLVLARDFYAAGGGEKPGAVAGYSIPASEHSTITSWGKEGELDAFENMLVKFPSGLVACVSDSFDIYKACGPEMWGKLKTKIINRPADALGNPGRLVIRPDSGDPKTVDLAILEILGETFGKRKNSKGYWVLDDHVRIIQGDGIKYETLVEILEHLKQAGWSAENIGFGSGGGLLQKLNRDTQKFAFKCSFIEYVDAAGQVLTRDVYKSPIDSPMKKSKKGRLTLHKLDGSEGPIVQEFLKGNDETVEYVKNTCLSDQHGWVTMQNGAGDPKTDLLQDVFLNGELVTEYSYSDIRKRAEVSDEEAASFDLAGLLEKLGLVTE